MKFSVVVFLCALSLTYASQSLLLDGLLNPDQVATDRCLSVSHLNYTVENLLRADIVAALNTLIADPAQSIGNITNFLKVVYTSALANNQYWLNGFSTNAYFGFSTDSVYSIRNCSLPENAILQGCMTTPPPAMLAYIRNNVTFAGSLSRHVWSVDNQGNLLDELYVESRESYASQNIWLQTPGWISFTSLTSHLQTFTYSKAVPGVSGVVAASDRSFREPCVNCLQTSPAVTVSESLNASMQLNQPSTLSDLNNLVKALYTDVSSVEATQVGFPSGDFVQLKDCSNRAAQPSGSYCSQTTSTYVAVIYAPVILSTSSIRVFNLSDVGQLDTTSYIEYPGYNSTSQQWYAIGQQNFGFSPIYLISDSSLVRSYVIQHGSGIVVASDTSESECETPTSTPVSTTTPSPSSAPGINPVASSAASTAVSFVLGSVMLYLM